MAKYLVHIEVCVEVDAVGRTTAISKATQQIKEKLDIKHPKVVGCTEAIGESETIQITL